MGSALRCSRIQKYYLSNWEELLQILLFSAWLLYFPYLSPVVCRYNAFELYSWMPSTSSYTNSLTEHLLRKIKQNFSFWLFQCQVSVNENSCDASIDEGDPAAPQHCSQSNTSDVRLPIWSHRSEPANLNPNAGKVGEATKSVCCDVEGSLRYFVLFSGLTQCNKGWKLRY